MKSITQKNTSYKPIFSHKRRVVIFELKKPIYGSFYAIWDKWLNKAKRLGYKIVIKTKEGTSTYENVGQYLNNAERLERYYKNPKVPMIFWGRHLKPDIDNRKKRKKVTRVVEDCSPPMNVMMRLKKEWDKKYA